MVKAILAIEDYRFYQHGALDLKGTLRALLTNQANAGVYQGGSSITQQMVKLTLIDPRDTEAEREAATDDTYARKLRELRYAIAVRAEVLQGLDPRALPQHRLLRRRRLRHPGRRTALLRRQRRELNLNQSAILAGLVKNPTATTRPTFPTGPATAATSSGPDGPAQRDHPRQGRRSSRRSSPNWTCSRAQRLRLTHGRRSSATTSALPPGTTRRSARPPRSGCSCSSPAA